MFNKPYHFQTFSGWFLLDLVKSTITNIKKTVAIAEEFLNDGELPSSKLCKNIYAQVLFRCANIDVKGDNFYGLINIVCHSKYDANRTHELNKLATNDGDYYAFGMGGRTKDRRLSKMEKNSTRSTEIGLSSSFVA